jgi:hypothetical protein
LHRVILLIIIARYCQSKTPPKISFLFVTICQYVEQATQQTKEGKMKNTKVSKITEHLRIVFTAIGLLGVFICASMLNHAYAAVIITEDFESDSLNTAYSANIAGSFDGPRTARDWHWQRHSTNTTSNTNFYQGFQGQDFWAGINLDENGSNTSLPSTLTLNSLNISNYQNTKLSLAVASSGGLEGSDYLAIYALGQTANGNQKILVDSFFGGISSNNGIILGPAFQTVRYDLSDLNFDLFSLHFEAFTNASKESVAFDNIMISGDLLPNSEDTGNKVTTVDSPSAFSALGLMVLAFGLTKRRTKLNQIFPNDTKKLCN